MSRDSNLTHIHLHSSRHADLFEEFCRPPSSTSHPSFQTAATLSSTNPNTNIANGDSTGPQHLPGSFLPYEEIYLPPHLMPINPEDEDDVVPDMHAAFGINRALGQNGVVANGTVASGMGRGAGQGTGETSNAGVAREAVWRDLGIEELLDSGASGEGRAGGWSAEVLGGMGSGGGERGGGSTGTVGAGSRAVTGARREGRRTGVLLLR